MLDVVGQGRPGMSGYLIDGYARRGELRIGERTDGYADDVRVIARLIINRRAAIGAEVEGDLISAVGRAHVNFAFAANVDLATRKTSLRSEYASGPALTRQAVAHRYSDGLALRRHA